MDTTGTFAMADELYKHGLMTAIHKHYTAAEWADWRERRGGKDEVLQYVCASSGILDDDWRALDAVLDENAVPMLCLDVANGYSEHFVNFVRRTREKFPKHTIMVSEEQPDTAELSAACCPLPLTLPCLGLLGRRLATW